MCTEICDGAGAGYAMARHRLVFFFFDFLPDIPCAQMKSMRFCFIKSRCTLVMTTLSIPTHSTHLASTGTHGSFDPSETPEIWSSLCLLSHMRI